RRRHTRSYGDWSSDVCSSDLTRTMRGPIVDNFFAVEEEPGPAVGVDAQAIVTINRRDKIATPSDGIVLGRDTRRWGDIVPLEIRSEERRVGKECRDREWAGGE